MLLTFITRYSILSKQLATGWAIGRQNYPRYRQKLFLPQRLQLHQHLFQTVTLPSVIQQNLEGIDNITVKHLVITSKALPEPFKSNLYQLAEQHHQLDIIEMAQNSVNLANIINRYTKQHATKGDFVVTVRLDDDDALSRNYCSQLSKYVRRLNIGYSISLGKGVAAIVSTEPNPHFSAFKSYYYPKIAIGLAYINFLNKRGILSVRGQNIFTQGAHTKVDTTSPTILDSREYHFMRLFHPQSDTFQRHIKAINRLSALSLEQVNEHFFIDSNMPYQPQE
ncbi:hypothetical protein D5085_02085 [Ectothiorhodospiraceae bacterium BW-2]|nr:hypothetical protein D5085_02085 [Ectothiorhodospiraceae bacterium BW-2]